MTMHRIASGTFVELSALGKLVQATSISPLSLALGRQRTFSALGSPAKPMHSESGYVRIIAPQGAKVNKIEFLLTAPNGVATVEEGVIEGHEIKIKLTSISKSSTARPPYTTELERCCVLRLPGEG